MLKSKHLTSLFLFGMILINATSGLLAAPKSDRLVIAIGGVSIPHTAMCVASEMKFFEKNGLKIEFKRVSSGFEALAAVQTGDAHVADAGIAVVAQTAQQGINVKAVTVGNGDSTGTVTTDNFFAIIGNKNKGLKSKDLSSLIGKKVGVPKGTVAHQHLYYALKNNGYDPNKDIIMQHVSPADLPTALQSGSVDAIACWEPMPLLALQMVSDSVQVYRGGNNMQYLFLYWMKPEFINKNPQIVQKFVNAFAESAQFSRKNHKKIVDIMVKSVKGLSRDVIDQGVNYLNFDIRVSKATFEAANQALEFAEKTSGFEGKFNFGEHIYLDALNNTLKNKPQLFKDLQVIPENYKI